MRAFKTKLAQIYRADRLKAAAILMILALLTIAGIWLTVEAFKHQTSISMSKNDANAAVAINHSYFTSLPVTPIRVTSSLIAGTSGSSGAFLNRRDCGDYCDGDMKTASFGTTGHFSEWVANTGVTSVLPNARAFPSSTTSTDKAKTFETAFPSVDAVPTTIGLFTSMLSDIPAARLAFTADEQTIYAPGLTTLPTDSHFINIASHEASETGVDSMATSKASRIENPVLSRIGAITSTFSPSGLELGSAAATPSISSSIGASLSATNGIPLTAATTIDASSSTESPSSSTTLTAMSAIATMKKEPGAASGEQQSPAVEANSYTIPNWIPFTSTHIIPTSALTDIESGISAFPTQGVPTTPLSRVAASISSSLASSLLTATITYASVSLNTSNATRPPTQLPSEPETAAPTASRTSSPTIAPSSIASKKPLSIGLGVCLPILALVAGFIILWLWIRRVERRKKDDLEKDIIWATPPQRTPNASGSLLNMTEVDHVQETEIGEKRAAIPVKLNPIATHPFNEEELAIARQYGLVNEAAKAQQGAGTMTSARSPVKTVQRRSGGTNFSRQWVDGANDTPRRPSQTFTRRDDGFADRFGDANAIGLAVTTDDHYRSNRDDLYHFQPTRLSTITDKSNEIEIPEMPASFGGAGSGLIKQGGDVKGRFLERFIMKRKGMMPLEG